MSLRAIKKRDSQLSPTSSATATARLFRKSAASTQLQQQRKFPNSNNYNNINHSPTSLAAIKKQRALLGRTTRSNPELRRLSASDADDTDSLERFAHARLVRTRSDSDVSALLHACDGNIAQATATGAARLLGAKSEVCLQTISSHSYPEQLQKATPTYQRTDDMLSGARSHRDLSQSTAYGVGVSINNLPNPLRRRMSECSSLGGGGGSGTYSQRTSAMSSSALTLGSSADNGGPNAVLRVPIIGYEVMEERARFTVYKLRVENPHTGDCWLVLRRYTDFVRLNTKLKQMFSQLTLMLPRKKIFGDNFNSVFLDNRVQGLQMFVNGVMAKEELRRCKMVRDFFCLDEPPSYSESMEECRAIFEAQEETITHLKLQVNNKNDLILNLQQKLRDEMLEKEQLKEALKNMSLNGSASSN